MTAAPGRVQRTGLGPARADVLAILRVADGPQPVQVIADAVGLHSNTARFHLDALVAAGLSTREFEKRDRPGRPKLLYRIVPQPADSDVLHDVAVALIRYLARLGDGSGDQAEAAGLLWGQDRAQAHSSQPALERVMSTLDALGYQPELVGDPAEAIVLRPCPLRSLLEDDSVGLPSVCRLHLGLMRGLLEDDPTVTVEELEPLTTPDTCVARLRRDQQS